MKKLICLLLALLLLTGCTAAKPQTTEQEQTDKAPDFTAYDSQGNPVSLHDFAGKPVILNFWASWCGPCKMEMPDFQAAYEKYGEQIHFVIVNLTDGEQETVESAQAHIQKNGYTFPVYYDKDLSGASAYSVRSIPLTLFLDSELNLVAYANTMLDAENLQKGIDMILPE